MLASIRGRKTAKYSEGSVNTRNYPVMNEDDGRCVGRNTHEMKRGRVQKFNHASSIKHRNLLKGIWKC